ncbi:anti-sigma factor domain-containing protein [Carboxydothermus hydrogenoformans]|uniref:RsgI N-terminal anti-sigma domain-containing protein n=1 Tax=Carboxydothermus hydrogenoformans (strain ATCC BAA-161 / DSM 6008 / Z-2901) TaxID=246194 RepID=Q3ABY4_CARHZ|nr:anti-sigma factor domain-containing protein [Carboxydothermus hydrogenoformans]ABB15139.1 conserved hypothetical protein [Carboxydothermus hydrogenoformans Z-2901]
MGRGVIVEKVNENSYLILSEGRFLQVKLAGSYKVGDEVEFPERTVYSLGFSLKIVALVASLLLFFAPVYLTYAKEKEVVAYLTVGGTRGVKIGINYRDKVIKVLPLSPEVEKYRDELKGLKVEQAITKVTSELGTSEEIKLEVLPGKKFNVHKLQKYLPDQKPKPQPQPSISGKNKKPVENVNKKEKIKTKENRKNFRENPKDDKIKKESGKKQEKVLTGGGGKNSEKTTEKINDTAANRSGSSPKGDADSGWRAGKGSNFAERSTQDREPKGKAKR